MFPSDKSAGASAVGKANIYFVHFQIIITKNLIKEIECRQWQLMYGISVCRRELRLCSLATRVGWGSIPHFILQISCGNEDDSYCSIITSIVISLRNHINNKLHQGNNLPNDDVEKKKLNVILVQQ